MTVMIQRQAKTVIDPVRLKNSKVSWFNSEARAIKMMNQKMIKILCSINKRWTVFSYQKLLFRAI